jgi:hypothetical protein
MMRNRGSISTALILIALGCWFLAVELFPGVKAFSNGLTTWPVPVIGIGVLLLLIGLFVRVPGLYIPACIVGGIGGLLYYQNLTGNWASWAYVWALIPAFVGVGIILLGIDQRKRGPIMGGAWTLFTGLLLYGIFGTAFGGAFIVTRFWPVLVIALGLVILGRTLIRPSVD